MSKSIFKIEESVTSEKKVLDVAGKKVTLVFHKDKGSASVDVAKEMLSSAYANSLFVTK